MVRVRTDRVTDAVSSVSADDPVPLVDVMGMSFVNLDEAACVEKIVTRCKAGTGGSVITPNLDILRQCVTDPPIAEMSARAEFLVADGMPIIWASQLQGTPLPERVCGSDLVWSISAAAADRGLSVFLLGGADDSAERAADVLRSRYPAIEIAGTYFPPFGFEADPAEMDRMTKAVEEAQPDIVFVGLPFPKSAQTIQRIRFVQPRAWWLIVGVSFSFVCGDVKRAPVVFQRLGLEWVHRLFQEPGRLFRRYLILDLPFALRLWSVSAWRGVTGWRNRNSQASAQ